MFTVYSINKIQTGRIWSSSLYHQSSPPPSLLKSLLFACIKSLCSMNNFQFLCSPLYPNESINYCINTNHAFLHNSKMNYSLKRTKYSLIPKYNYYISNLKAIIYSIKWINMCTFIWIWKVNLSCISNYFYQKKNITDESIWRYPNMIWKVLEEKKKKNKKILIHISYLKNTFHFFSLSHLSLLGCSSKILRHLFEL